VYTGGSLLAIPRDAFLAGDMSKIQVLFKPTNRSAMETFSGTRNFMMISVLENVQSKVLFWKYDFNAKLFVDADRPAFTFPDFGTVHVQGHNPDVDDNVWFTRTGFTSPTTLMYGNIATVDAYPGTVCKQLPSVSVTCFFFFALLSAVMFAILSAILFDTTNVC
jgi:prolyl oligopeptidase